MNGGGGGTQVGGASIIPTQDNMFNLGSSSFRWNTLYAATGIVMGSGGVISTSAGELVLTPFNDTIGVRRASASQQAIDLYNSYTDAANYSRLRIQGGSGHNILAQRAGSGTARSLTIGTDGFNSAEVNFMAAGTIWWVLTTAGAWEPFLNNTVNIGSSSKRVAVFYTNALSLGANPASGGAIRLANASIVTWRNAANNGDIDGIAVDTSNNVILRGATDGWTLSDAGLFPNVDNVDNLGSAAKRVAGVFCTEVIADFVDGGDTASQTLAIRSTNHATKGSVNICDNGADVLNLAGGTGAKIGAFGAGAVTQPAAVADASGGATVDAEARTAINALLARIRSLGFIAT